MLLIIDNLFFNPRIHHRSGPHLASQFQAAWAEIGSHHFRCSCTARRRDDQTTNGACANHQYAFAGQLARLFYCMNSDRQRFRKGHHVCRHAPIVRNTLLRFYHHVFRKTAIHMWIELRAAHKAHGAAQILMAGKAHLALIAGAGRVHSNRLANFQLAACWHFADHANKLMANHHRMLEDRHPRAAMLIVVDIRATDAAASDLHDDIMFIMLDFT